MSLKIKVYNQSAEAVSDLSLSDKIFAVEASEDLLHQAIVAQSANERQVLAHTKDRSEVRGGGKKPWKQKGTGRARAGSSRSPIWIGGGVTFGPTKDRNFKKKINKKMKQKAMFMALSDKVSNNTFVVVDKLELKEYKTKQVDKVLSAVEKKVLKNERRSILVINDAKDDKLKYSGRNLEGAKVINLDNINIIDLLGHKNVLISEKAVKSLEEKYNKKKI